MNRGSWPARSRGVVRSWGSQLMTFRHQRFALSPMNTCSGCGRSPRPRALTSYRQKSFADPAVTLWTAWRSDQLVGCGAVKHLDADNAEIKSMRVPQRFTRQGIGRTRTELNQ